VEAQEISWKTIGKNLGKKTQVSYTIKVAVEVVRSDWILDIF
jgi:hypothetical protein